MDLQPNPQLTLLAVPAATILFSDLVKFFVLSECFARIVGDNTHQTVLLMPLKSDKMK